MISYFLIFTGISIIGLWIMLGLTNQIIEFETEPISIVFHIFIEISMGLIAIIGGVFMLKGFKYSREIQLFVLGMVVYSVVNSSGYYGDLGEYIMIFMFGILLIISIISVLYLSKSK